MSSGMSRPGLKTAASAVLAGEDRDKFYANLTDCLHALGQPLTVLRWAVVAANAPGVSAENQRKYLNASEEQTELVCSLFSCLRELVNTSRFPANCIPVELSELLSPVVGDQKSLLETSSVSIEVIVPDGRHPLVRADKERTSQALLTALQVAASVSSPGDVIELPVTLRKGEIELTIQSRRAQGKNLGARGRLSLASAEANIRSQNGQYRFTGDPFCVSLTLPLAEWAQEGVNDPLLGTDQVSGEEPRQESLAHQSC